MEKQQVTVSARNDGSHKEYHKPQMIAKDKYEENYAAGCPPKGTMELFISTCKSCERTR